MTIPRFRFLDPVMPCLRKYQTAMCTPDVENEQNQISKGLKKLLRRWIWFEDLSQAIVWAAKVLVFDMSKLCPLQLLYHGKVGNYVSWVKIGFGLDSVGLLKGISVDPNWVLQRLGGLPNDDLDTKERIELKCGHISVPVPSHTNELKNRVWHWHSDCPLTILVPKRSLEALNVAQQHFAQPPN